MKLLAFGVADLGVIGELLAGLWKLTSDWGSQPGTWLVAGGLAIALVTMWKAPKVAEAEGDDKVDAAHPVAQIVLRLISNGPRLFFSGMAVGALVFGLLDLTGKVPLSEKRAAVKIQAEQAAHPAPAAKHWWER